MSWILYYFILKPLSLLPLSTIYLFTDILYFVLFSVIGYRKEVVRQNLKNSFPKKSDQEIQKIQTAFFRHLCDLIAESIKLFSISENELSKRFYFKNPEIMERFYKKGQNVILAGGHYNNWEITAVSLNRELPHQVIGIYSPLSNKFFNKKIAESRTKFGVQIITKSEVRSSFAENRNKRTVTVFGTDQSPTYSKNVYWKKFLNQDTAVAIGTELFAAKYNYPVFFMKVRKVKRGHYEGELELLTDNPTILEDGMITELHTRALEKMIHENPQHWLWSHKRWKRKMTEQEKLEMQEAAAA